MKRDEIELQVMIEVILKILTDKRVLTLGELKAYMDQSLLRLEKSGVLADEEAKSAHDRIEMRLISLSAARRRTAKPKVRRAAKAKRSTRRKRR